MKILDQKVLLEQPEGIFTVNADYSLNNQTLKIPQNFVLRFDGGSLNNGTIVFDNTVLENVSPHSIDATTKGTISNKIVKMSWFADVNQVNIDFANQTIEYDEDAVITSTVVVPGNNIVYDGKGNNFTCRVTFFCIEGKSNITIQNFNATAAENIADIDFQEMPTTAANVVGININNNTLNGFRVGISLNSDQEAYSVSDSIVYNNHIENCKGQNPGQGYGIHLAHAINCTVSGNTLINCARHSIYHAFGDGNKILNNVIRNHRMDYMSDLNVRSALEILRKSTNVLVKGNVFVNCYNVCILVYAFPYYHDGEESKDSPHRYGCCENITIEDNTFVMSGVNVILGLPSIMLGYLYDGDETPYKDFANHYVNNVDIKGNYFLKASTENLECIRIDQCKKPTIEGNNFQFNAPSTGHEEVLIEIRDRFKNDEEMRALIQANSFYALNNISNFSVYCIGNLKPLINSLFDITVAKNIFVNQYNGNQLNYMVYQPTNIINMPSFNLHLQTEGIRTST